MCKLSSWAEVTQSSPVASKHKEVTGCRLSLKVFAGMHSPSKEGDSVISPSIVWKAGCVEKEKESQKYRRRVIHLSRVELKHEQSPRFAFGPTVFRWMIPFSLCKSFSWAVLFTMIMLPWFHMGVVCIHDTGERRWLGWDLFTAVIGMQSSLNDLIYYCRDDYFFIFQLNLDPIFLCA